MPSSASIVLAIDVAVIFSQLTSFVIARILAFIAPLEA